MVNELMVVEGYSYVMHIVSNVFGKLAPHKTALVGFPQNLSRISKVWSMEIIHELESYRRGLYFGVYRYYDFEGQLNSAIAIRTMVVCNIIQR